MIKQDEPQSPAPRAHAHPAPDPGTERDFDVIVVGGGHAGVEAALAAARLGCRTALVSLRLDRIGEMSCNPAIGGLGKGQLVREIDALGGVMGRVADSTGIQFRMLGTGKGAAARGPRAQSDRHLYREEVTRIVRAAPGVECIEGSVVGLRVEQHAGRRVLSGVRFEHGRELACAAVVLTTGTFLSAIMHTGEDQAAGGRAGEGTSQGLSGTLAELGLSLGRLKTGTPPRLAADSIDWNRLEEQHGDCEPVPFSFATERAHFPRLPQIACHLTWTNSKTHDLIRDNIHRAPMYAGRIDGVGPRYCPSVEDKVMRFADKQRHQVFLEPEGLTTDVVYVNGVSTSLPAEVQEAMLHTIEGLERARFLRHGYAVEYDFVAPAQMDDTLSVRNLAGLYLAGQINGTSGYEEAAAQGLMAGANAALWIQAREPFVLGRHEAYVGVMIDDLVVSQPTEPYRMFTSRAEYRLLLRADNADRRLTPRAASIGLAESAALKRLDARVGRIQAAVAVLESVRCPEHGQRSLAELLRRPESRWTDLERRHPQLATLALDAEDANSVEVDIKYAGYVAREKQQVERLQRQERLEIPTDLDFALLRGLANEAKQKLAQVRPRTLGAASRVAGVRPPDVALLAVHLERRRRQGTASSRSLAQENGLDRGKEDRQVEQD